MTQIVFSLTLAAIAFWAAHDLLYPRFFGDPPAYVSSMSLEDTITDLKLELALIGGTPGDTAGLELGDVTIELTTQKDDTKSAQASLAVPVFKESALESKTSVKLTQGSKMTLVLQAPSGEIMLGQPKKGRLDLSELALAARSALLSTMSKEPQLIPKSVEIELSFVFVETKSAKAEIKAFVVGIGAESEAVTTGGNKITLNFVNSKMLAEAKKQTEAKQAVIPPK
ncbi:MAG: trypco2 family protein [Sulfitobacter sp.]